MLKRLHNMFDTTTKVPSVTKCVRITANICCYRISCTKKDVTYATFTLATVLVLQLLACKHQLPTWSRYHQVDSLYQPISLQIVLLAVSSLLLYRCWFLIEDLRLLYELTESHRFLQYTFAITSSRIPFNISHTICLIKIPSSIPSSRAKVSALGLLFATRLRECHKSVAVPSAFERNAILARCEAYPVRLANDASE